LVQDCTLSRLPQRYTGMETQSLPQPRDGADDLSDPERLLELARDNDRKAFRALVVRSQSRIFSAALRLTGLRADAEELAQDVFVQLHAAIPRITDVEHLDRWLLRTVYHRSIDRLRQR